MSFHIIYTIINYYFLNLRIDIYLNISDQNHGNVPISSPNPTSKISRRSSSNSSSRTKGTTEDEYIQRKPRPIIKQTSQEGKYFNFTAEISISHQFILIIVHRTRQCKAG